VLVKISDSHCGYLLPYFGNLISQVAANRAIRIRSLAVMHMKPEVVGGQALSNVNSTAGISGERWGRGAHGERQGGPPRAAASWLGAFLGTPGLAGKSQSREAASTSLIRGVGARAGHLTLPLRGESSLERLQLSARHHTVSKQALLRLGNQMVVYSVDILSSR